MKENTENSTTRREFLKNTGRFAAASALVGMAIPHVHAAENNLPPLAPHWHTKDMAIPHVHAAENNTIQIALVGCGGRGSGAADNALSVKNGPLKLVAMADVFEDRLAGSYEALTHAHSTLVDVPPERRFVGFDAYKKAIDCLRPGDVVIFATPPAFRWVHFTYAIEKGVNVFMEKPVTVDGPTTKKMIALGEEAKKKNLKVGVGLMCRHCLARKELYTRIQDGAIGDLITIQAYRMHGPVAACFAEPNPPGGMSELLYQIKNFHSFLWASGGLYSDFYIHNVDEGCWMKNALPVKAQALGGRHYRGNAVDQNFDTYSVEYTFADGTKMFLDGRTMGGCREEHTTRALGSKGSTLISASGHMPAKSATFKGYDYKTGKTWAYAHAEPNPYQLEWDDLIDAIRTNKPYNEVQRGAEVSLVTSMGRMAAHTGQIVTWDEMMKTDHEFAPGVDQLTMTSAAPLLADASGKYPIPQPGIITTREF